MRKILSVCLVLVAFAATAADAENTANALVKTGIVLLQPESVLQQRVPDVAALAAYIRAIESVAAKTVATSRPELRGGGFLVVAVRPGNESNVWLDLRPGLPAQLAKSLVSQIRAIPTPAVSVGPVVLALKVSIWGGESPSTNMPQPSEWKRAAEAVGHPIETGALVEQIWAQ